MAKSIRNGTTITVCKNLTSTSSKMKVARERKLVICSRGEFMKHFQLQGILTLEKDKGLFNDD